MTFDIKKHFDELLFLPLGGAGEIGMNLNLYHYKGKWIIADLGAGFADDFLPGVDMIVPDITFLMEHRKDLLGIVLSHAHEDHIGGIQYLWEELNHNQKVKCPIYATNFTKNFLTLKLAESGFRDVKITEVPIEGSVDLGPFKVEMFPLTHSAPEMQSLIIKTDLGTVFHTGDWKFDDDPLIGFPANKEKLKKFGDEGILAIVGDSTNVFNDTASGSEGKLKKSLYQLIEKCPEMVVVTTFATNLARLESLIKAGDELGRKVVIAGRSLWRIIEAAKASGYLQDIPELLPDKMVSKFPRSKLLVIATGCQGERLAAINKIATENHQNIRLAPGDTVIFSSKIIPGNDKRIFALFNKLVQKKVEVLTEKDHFVHVSGHPSKEELKTMYELLRPEISIPVHGEMVHIHEHVNFAKSLGVKHGIQVENGKVVKLAPGEPQIIAQVHSGYLAIDGYFLLSANSGVMKTRRRIQTDGAIIITLLLSPNFDLVERPILNAPGSLDPKEDFELIAKIVDTVMEAVENEFLQSPKKNKTNANLENLVRASIRRIIKSDVGKNPIIEVNLVNCR